jgi:2'-5' RNA ligase
MAGTPHLNRLLALTPQTPEASTVPKPIGRPGGPGLWRHKELQLPPYIQHVAHALMRQGHGESDAVHMAVGIVQHWAEGHDGHGHKTHPDVRAAAAANVAKWEETRGKAHALHAAKEHGKGAGSKKHHDLAATPPPDLLGRVLGLAATIASAPGARPLAGRLRQAPSQTVAAGPPLPPGVTLPTPAELNSLSSAISKAGVPDSDLVRGAAKHARAAAMKMAANQPADALHCLRSAQTGIVSAHREYNASLLPVANVFSARLAPAEQASARAEMAEGIRTRDSFRALASQCAQHIDRIRRHIFHGMYNHMAEARFSMVELAAPEISASSAMIYLQAPPDLFPDTGLDKPGHLTVVYLGKISPARYDDACERARAAAKSLPPVHATIGGLGRFEASGNSDGMAVAYCPVYGDGIHMLRALLADLAAGDSMPFVPHITMAYLRDGEPGPEPVTSARLCFRQLYCARGDQIRAYALSGTHEPHGAGSHYRDRRAGEAPLSRSSYA